jgi:putative flippase GtrA
MLHLAKKAIRSRSAQRYLAVGVTSLAIDYSALLICYRLIHMPLFVATSIAFCLGLFINFLLNKYWTFTAAPRSAKQNARQALLYAFLVVFNLGFTNLFILSLGKAHIGPEITKPISTAIITLWNYILYRKVIFKIEQSTDLERSMM